MDIQSIHYSDPDHIKLAITLPSGRKITGTADLNRWPEHLRDQVQAYLDGGGTIEDYQEPPDLRTYDQKRSDAYPPVGDVIDAICTYLETGDKTEFDAIQAERNAVKAAIPITLE